MAINGKITLKKHFFSELERTFADFGELKASIFIYENGVHGIKLENQKGYRRLPRKPRMLASGMNRQSILIKDSTFNG